MCEVYVIFSKDWENICDYSHERMLELYVLESTGKGRCDDRNGYSIGKRYLNVTLKMWKEDLSSGILFKEELYNDGKYPTWWLDKVLKNMGV